MSYSIDKTTEFIKVTYWGSLTNDDIQAVTKYALNNNVIDFINRIEDMRKLDSVNLGFKELSGFTQNLRTLQLPRIVKTAILTNGPLQYGIARMFQIILDHPKMKIEIFSNEEEAYKWISSVD